MLSVVAGIPGSVSYEEIEAIGELMKECIYADHSSRYLPFKLAQNTCIGISVLTGCLVGVIVTYFSLMTVGLGKVTVQSNNK